MSHRRIDDAIETGSTSAIGECVSNGVRLGFVRMKAGMVRHLAKVEEVASQAAKHLRILHNRVEISCIRERFGEVIANFAEARGHIERCIPRPAICAIEAVRLLGLGISEGRIDEVSVRNIIDKLIGSKSGDTAILCNQPGARCPFNLCQGPQIILLLYEWREDGRAQSSGRYQPDRPWKGLSDDRHRIGRQSEAPADRVDVAAHLQHQRDTAFDHRLDRAHPSKQRPLVAQARPPIGHLVGKQEVKSFIDADQR